MKMPGLDVPGYIFKDRIAYHKKICPSCKKLLRDPVQLTVCGHNTCESCAKETLKSTIDPKCPECKKKLHREDGEQLYFPDGIIQGEIYNLFVICPFSRDGCCWEGKFEGYEKHTKSCTYKTALIPPTKPFLSRRGEEQEELTQLDESFPEFFARKGMNHDPSSEMDHNQERKPCPFAVQAPFKMPGIPVQQKIFKGVDDETFTRHICPECKLVLRDAVQPACGHWICQSCADEILAKETSPCCPECNEPFEDEDGAYYFPDRFARREIKNLVIICPFSEMGCNWEGKFKEYQQHVEVCKFALLDCEFCGEKVQRDQIKHHIPSCPGAPKRCPLAVIGCSENLPKKQSDLQNHLQTNQTNHLELLVVSLENLKENSPKCSSLPQYYGKPTAIVEDPFSAFKSHDLRRMLTSEIDSVRNSVFSSMNEKLQSKDEEIASLRAQVTKLEKQIRSKSAELEDRDFRLSLIENSNHDGSMIWKIPQFSQRKGDAENGKYTSIFSLPFYTGRYGYKMCLRLYIMGDGIGKGTHLSLFFVVMRGEFDNILQWPFTHKVTFKLINQAGGRDIVDTFQPDPMSSSFRKPKSDMNIASGCPRFVSHTELERGGFIVDDTIFIKCMIDTSTICHP